MTKLPTIRRKSSDMENVLPPVAELLADDNTVFHYTDLDGNPAKLDFCEAAAADPYPLPMPVDREGYGTVEFTPRFWATGHSDWLNVQDAIQRFMPEKPAEGEKLRVLDFGCASGRVLRHAHTFSGETTDIWGCDFAPENVNWVKRYLSSDIKIFLNNANPHLPFTDGYFDVITAFSVFTHIDLFEDAWLLELRRITKPGGLLYLTTQNDASWPRVVDRPHMLKHIEQANKIKGNPTVSKDLFESEMPSDRIVFRMSEDENYNCNVWMTNDYIRQTWSRYFDVHHIADNAHTNFQSPVIMSPSVEPAGRSIQAESAKNPSVIERPKPR